MHACVLLIAIDGVIDGRGKNMVTSKFDISIFKLIYDSCVVEIQTLYQN